MWISIWEGWYQESWVNLGLYCIAIVVVDGFFYPSALVRCILVFVDMFVHATAFIHRYPCDLDSLA